MIQLEENPLMVEVTEDLVLRMVESELGIRGCVVTALSSRIHTRHMWPLNLN